jgi:hypothetical protein
VDIRRNEKYSLHNVPANGGQNVYLRLIS